MKLKNNIMEDLTRNDVKFYETKLNTFSKKISKKKIPNDKFRIPKINEYEHIIMYNFNVAQLRIIAKNYKLKISGNKNELNKRIYLSLLYNYNAIRIQKCVRRKFVYKYIKAHGPAFKKRDLCVNNQDFFSLEKLKNVDYVNFFTEIDNGKCYGFDIVSLYNFIRNERSEGKKYKNPFTNCDFESPRLYHRVKRFIKLSRRLNTGLNVNSIEEENNNSNINSFEFKVRDLFHHIDTMGNYSNPDWFLNLSRGGIIKFIRELHDIWNYRAELSEQAKRNICNPIGNPFICRHSRMPLITIITDLISTEAIKIRGYLVMENMVRYSINQENSAIGCYYLLGALTLVSQDASEALPWLYQCMYHS